MSIAVPSDNIIYRVRIYDYGVRVIIAYSALDEAPTIYSSDYRIY